MPQTATGLDAILLRETGGGFDDAFPAATFAQPHRATGFHILHAPYHFQQAKGSPSQVICFAHRYLLRVDLNDY